MGMDIFIGLDAGTSKLAAVALDLSGDLLVTGARANDSELPAQPPGRHEQAPGRLLELALLLLRDVCTQLGGRAAAVRGIGLTGQMHGVLLVGPRLEPLSNLITWQDQRAGEPFGDGPRSYVEECLARVGRHVFEEAAVLPAAGYMGVTLFWLRRNGRIPEGARWALMCHDWLAARLAGADAPATDPTDAASSGMFSVRDGQWHDAICNGFGVDRGTLPRVAEAGDVLGRISPRAASETGLPKDATVHVPLGDNQAGALACLRDTSAEVLVNVGTGGQTSAVTESLLLAPDIEPRPFPGRKVLACGMSLCGGAAFRYLAEHYARAIREFTGTDVPLSDILTDLVRLADAAPQGAEGLEVEPLFQGKRSAPAMRGGMRGMSLDNNTPAAWARAFIEGMVADLAGHYRRMLAAGLEPRSRLVVAGNAMRLNPVMRRVAAEAFQMPSAMPAWEEEAACGAALAAMVGSGAIASFEAAGELVRHVGDQA